MKDADLKRNASGYYDETAYKAITAPPKTGEIWTNSSGTKCWLILRSRDTVCSTLLLGKEEKENCIMIMGRVPMYTNPVMIGYTFTVYVTTFVKTVPADKMAEVQKAVGNALGITATVAVPHDNINALEEKVLRLTKERDEAQKTATALKFDLGAKNADEKMWNDTFVKMSQEITKLNIYKDMYMDLIDKLVAVRGGCRQ